MLEKYDTLAAEAACEEDEDSARLECWSRFCRVNGLSNLWERTSQHRADRFQRYVSL